MIPFSVDDFVITCTGTKNDLLKVVSRDRNSIYGVRESQRSDEHVEHVVIDPNSVIANLGNNPKLGSVYGKSTEIFQGKKELDGWGTVKFFRKLDKKELKILKKSFIQAAAIIEKVGINLHPFETEIRESRGKWAGTYHFRPKEKDGKSLDLIQFKPKTIEDLLPLILHELGHSVWYRRTSAETKARWILAYQRAIKLQKITLKEITKILNDFFKSGSFCREYSLTLTDDDNKIFQDCLAFAQEKHRLSPKHLDLLISNSTDISKYFTIEDIKLQDIELVLTEYAKESAEEFFAEAFSLQLGGKILPKSLRTLMELTLTKAARYQEQEE